MWYCPFCNQAFVHTNQYHSCNDKTLDDFLNNKTAHTLELFYYFIEEYKQIGDFKLHPTKSQIGLANHTRFCAITQLGRNFLHFVFSFKESFNDNLCFTKIGQLPGTNDFNHHCRIYSKDDLNGEVRLYMKMAYKNGLR
jgi:hypothetical protein